MEKCHQCEPPRLFIDEAGLTVVIQPGPKPNIVAQKSIKPSETEIFRATITPSGGQVLIRSDQVLYCIGSRATAAK